MANTFKTVTFAAEPASAGTPYTMYTVASSTTTVILGLILTNIHTTGITVEVELVSTTANRNGANNVANGTSFLVKDVYSIRKLIRAFIRWKSCNGNR